MDRENALILLLRDYITKEQNRATQRTAIHAVTETFSVIQNMGYGVINIWWLSGTLWNSFLQWWTTFWLAASQIWCSLFEYELFSVGVHHVRLLFWYLGYKVRERFILLMEGIHCTVSVCFVSRVCVCGCGCVEGKWWSFLLSYT